MATRKKTSPRRNRSRQAISDNLDQGSFQVAVNVQASNMGMFQLRYACWEPQSPRSVKRYVTKLLGGTDVEITRAYLIDRGHPARCDWETTSII
jgi:hypothetical protein